MLLPDTVTKRDVREGRLGCPVCGRDYPIVDGVARFGTAPSVPPNALDLTGEGLAALLGITGPGGYLALVGSLARLAGPLATVLDGVHIVVVNPPMGFVPGDGIRMSVLHGPTIPLKRRSLRAVGLGEGVGADPQWIGEAVRSILPGQRVVGVGPPPAGPLLETLASAEGVWVSRIVAGG